MSDNLDKKTKSDLIAMIKDRDNQLDLAREHHSELRRKLDSAKQGLSEVQNTTRVKSQQLTRLGDAIEQYLAVHFGVTVYPNDLTDPDFAGDDLRLVRFLRFLHSNVL